MSPTSSSSRTWWSRSSNRLSGSKKLNTIATAIGLKPKKAPTPIEEPTSPVLPLHTGDIETPPRTSKPVVKPVSVAVGWADPRALEPEHFLEAYPQSVFSTDLDPFAAAAKYPHGHPTVSDSLRFSTFSEVSTLGSRLRKDAPHVHNRSSFASSSSLSHQRSDVTPDSSPVSSPLLSPATSGRHLSRLNVECERMCMRDNSFSPSSVSPQSLWDDRSYIAASPSSVTLKDTHGNGSTVPRPRTRSRGFIDTGHLRTDPVVSDQKVSPLSLLNAPSPRVVVRQPSSGKLQPLRPRTAPPSSELPPAPDDVQQHDFSLMPAFIERTPQSATSSSSSLSFASSFSSRLDTPEAEGRRRDIRRLKDPKKPGKSRPTFPSADAIRDIHGLTSKLSSSCREFSPTRSLKKAISIQNLPKRAMGTSTPPSLPSAEDTKSVKKQRSFHRTRIPMPPLPASLKQTSSSNSASGRDALSVPEECRASTQSSQKSPLSSPVLSPTSVRRRLFSGTSLRQSTSSQTPEPDDDTPSIFSLPSVTSTTRPHTAITTTHESSISHKPDFSSFWDDETPNNPSPGGESRDLGPQHILSAADILKFENMVRDGENLNGFVSSRERSITQTASKHSAHTTYEQSTSARSLFPPSATRQFDSLGTASSKFLPQGRQRTRGNSLQGKMDDVGSGRSRTGVASLGQSVRSVSVQSLNALRGLPPPPRQYSRPSTSSGASSQSNDDVPLFTTGNRSSVIALAPLSPPPMRRSATPRTFEPPPVTPILRPGISRTPSFLDMREDMDRELPPLEDSFLDMGKASLDTVRSGTEEDLVDS